MKVQVKRAFKGYFFVTKKTITKQTGSAWNVFQTSIQVCRGARISYLKINTSIFCCLICFEEYLNPQVRIHKMLIEHTVNYHLVIQNLLQGYTLLYLYGLLGDLCLQNISRFFSKLIYPTMVEKNVSNSRC